MKSALIVALFSVFASGAQAQGIFSKDFLAKTLSKKDLRIAATPEPSCTDFSGHWVGTCTYNGAQPTPSEVTLFQIACEGLAWQGLAIPVHGVLSISSMPSRAAQHMGAGTIQFQTVWNSLKTEIAGKVRITTPDSLLSDWAVISVNLKMNGKTLEVNQAIHIDNQPDQAISCSYQHP